MNMKKAVMVGCGFVGSASVFALMQSGLLSEIALIDVNKEKAEGEAMDISHGIPFARHMRIYAGDYDDVKDAVSSIREVSQSIRKEIEDYMAKPETQESIRKAKITTVRLAERGLSALKTFLKVEEEPKE